MTLFFVALLLEMSEKKRQIQVEGMTCTNCALSVTKRLEKLGLREVNTDFLSGEVHFAGDIEFETISSELRKIGYQALSEKKEDQKGLISPLEWKFLFSLLFSVPLFMHMFLPHDAFLNRPWVQFWICLPVFLLGAWHFGKSAWGSLRSGVANMDVLIIIGASAAFFYSLWATLLYGNSHQIHHYLFYETASTIISLVLLGNVIEHRSVNQTTTAIRELTRLQKVSATRIRIINDKEIFEKIPAEQIAENDLVQVNNGDNIPVDAIVISGEAKVNEAMLTGESLPVTKTTGDQVIGGSILLDGNIRIKASSVGKNSTLAKIIELVKQAQQQKPELQKLGDKISSIFVPVVVGISILTFLLAWLVFETSIQAALLQSIAVLVISCPCAMGLATPTAIVAGVGRAAKSGILIKGGDTLEKFAGIKKIVLDKTGTLTTGKFSIGDIRMEEGIQKKELLNMVLTMEQHSSHPIAKSMVEELKHNYEILPLKDLVEIKGKGLRAIDQEGVSWEIGSSRILPDSVAEQSPDTVYVIRNGKLIARISISDEIKPNAEKMIADFRSMQIRVIMLSGDKNENCEKIARQLGIEEWYGEHLPEEKLEKIKALNKNNDCAMVGDGINDAPALSAAAIGVSLGDATQVAIHSAQIIILGKDLSKLPEAYRISKQTFKTIRQNLFWAFFYNAIAIPIAAVGLLSPMIAALSMAFSDVIVVGNSIHLKTKKLK